MTKPLSDMKKFMNANGTLPDDCTIGNITYYNVADGEYDGERMKTEFDRLALNPAFLPTPINPADAWEKASKELDGSKFTLPINGRLFAAEILVRDLSRDKFEITRALIRETRNDQQHVLQHDEIARVTFYRPPMRGGKPDYSGTRHSFVISSKATESERAILGQLRLRYDAAYARYCQSYDGQRIRTIIRAYLGSLNSILMKPSLYFVHTTRADELNRFAEWVAGLEGGGCGLVLIPLADLPALRKEVIDTFQREAVKDFANVIADVAKLKNSRTGPPTRESWIRVKAQYDAVVAKANEYGRTLHLSQDLTASAAEDAHDVLATLLEEVTDTEIKRTAARTTTRLGMAS